MRRLKDFASTLVLLLVFGSIGGMIAFGAMAPVLTWFYPDNEIAQERQWSVLRSLWIKYEDESNTAGVLLLPRAMRSSYTALGLPRTDQQQGYVWVLVDPSGPSKLKSWPTDTPFHLKTYELHNIQGRLPLDPEVLAFLRQGVEP